MDPELINEFVRESYDLLDNVEPTLIELSVNSDDGNVSPELINTTFRLFHSLKGNAGFLDFKSIASLTHEAETVLDLIRHNKLDLRTDIMLLLCESMDLLRAMLERIESSGSDKGFEDKVDDVSIKLQSVVSNDSDSEPAAKVEEVVEISDEMRDIFVKEGVEQLEAAEQAMLSFFPEDCPKDEKSNFVNEAFRNIHSFKGNCGFMGIVQLENISHLLETAIDEIREGNIPSNSETQNIALKTLDTLKDGVSDVRDGGSGKATDYEISVMLLDSILPAKKVSAFKEKNSGEAKTVSAKSEEGAVIEQENKAQSTGASIVRRDIRVDLTKLDDLINLIGELVIAEAMVTRCPAVVNIDDQYYERSKDQLRRICENLQDIAMSVRMVPLSATFKKMIRLVHDLSLKAGKQIKLHISGESTEVDKTVIEQISDPLVHIIRNSCDHGVESPSDRIASGKQPEGNVHIDAKHEGGEVWIVITDDGKGLGKERIVDKAINRGLLNPEQMSSMKDSDIFNLIFEPGFSTAEKVTNISGRGVGMDVVKRNIESLNGKIDVESTEGKGTTFKLRIPLTLAIIDGMLVRVGKTCYVVPLLSIKESLRATESLITRMPDGQEYFRLREDMIPVLRMHELFKCSCDSEDLTKGILIVVEDNARTVALFVDELLGQQQTVIKGISEYLGEAKFCSGCTILGDGNVSLILNMSTLVSKGISQLRGVLSEEDASGVVEVESVGAIDVETPKEEDVVYINPKFKDKEYSVKNKDIEPAVADEKPIVFDMGDEPKEEKTESQKVKEFENAENVTDTVFINPKFINKKKPEKKESEIDSVDVKIKKNKQDSKESVKSNKTDDKKIEDKSTKEKDPKKIQSVIKSEKQSRPEKKKLSKKRKNNK